MDKDRVYCSASARKVCTLLYKRNVYANTWNDWRKALKIRPKAKKLTEDQYLNLCAIAYITSDNPQKDLTWEEIHSVRELIGEAIKIAMLQVNSVHLLGNRQLKSAKKMPNLIQGRDVQSFLKKKGLPVPHIATIYRKIPGFSLDGCYRECRILRLFKQNAKAA